MKNKLKLSILLIFVALITSACKKNTKEASMISKFGTNSHIEWDYSTLKKVSSSANNEQYCGYARMIQLNDKSLLVVYEADGQIVVRKSMDLGLNWSSPVLVAAGIEGIHMTVPSILQLKDQSLLVCYNARPYQMAANRKFGIRVKKSSDEGHSWNNEKIVYEAGTAPENGCWEPSAIQLKSGEIQLFFANEGVYTNSDEQNISLLRSKDLGNNWSTTPEIVSFMNGKRDGMPVPLLLNDGENMVIAIENNGTGNFKPSTLRNTVTENWSTTIDAQNNNRMEALSKPLEAQIYAGAPFLSQLKTGETLLSYQGTEGRDKNELLFADMKVLIGDEFAKDFSRQSIPFNIPKDKFCLWNSLTVLEDQTIVAVTSTNAYSNKVEVWMIKGKLVEDSLASTNDSLKDPIALADPTIFYDQGNYYLYGTSSDQGFQVYQSSDLKSWKGPVGKNKGYALSKGESFGNTGFWAPQVFKHEGAYYMAYTADEQIAIAKSDSPLGPFKQEKLKALSSTGKQIDPFIYFDANGKVYLYHVRLDNGNKIYVAEMKSDLSDVLQETAKVCISASLPWENTDQAAWPVTEGPTVIRHDGLYYMLYSANDFRSIDYSVGYATATSAIGPWKKYEGSPIISRQNIKKPGTGHGDVFVDVVGNYHYVFHTHYSETSVFPRSTGLVTLAFEKEPSSDNEVLKAKEASFTLLYPTP